MRLGTHATTVQMTVGNPKKVIISFAMPVFLSQLFQQLYNSADSLIVGRYLGKQALAAVSSSGNLIFLLVSFFIGTSMGAGVVISRYFGAGDNDKVSRSVHTNVLLSLLLGVFLTAFGVVMTPVFLRWMGTPENVLPQSIAYFRYYFYGALSMVMYNVFKGILNAVGDSKRPLYYLIFSSVLNIFLDWLFIGVFHLGIEWAAIATTISQTVSAILCLIQLLKKNLIYSLSWKKLRISSDMLREILKYGLPTGVQNSVIGLANVLVQTNINSFGDNAMAACGAYAKVEGFAFLPITSFSMALTTFIGQNLGAKEYDRAKQGARFGFTVSVIMAELIGVATYLGAPVFISAFNDFPEVVRIGVLQSRTESLFFCLLAFSHCIAGICRGAGKAMVPMFIMLSVWCVFRIIYITVAMSIAHEIQLLFWAYPITWFISSVIYLVYYLKSDWIHGFETQKKKHRFFHHSMV